jgi:hypothetical protein
LNVSVSKAEGLRRCYSGERSLDRLRVVGHWRFGSSGATARDCQNGPLTFVALE